MGAKFSEEKQDDIAAMHALCALMHAYVRVEFPGMRSLGMLLMQFSIAFSWIVGFFCVTHSRTLCVSESQMGV